MFHFKMSLFTIIQLKVSKVDSKNIQSSFQQDFISFLLLYLSHYRQHWLLTTKTCLTLTGTVRGIFGSSVNEVPHAATNLPLIPQRRTSGDMKQFDFTASPAHFSLHSRSADCSALLIFAWHNLCCPYIQNTQNCSRVTVNSACTFLSFPPFLLLQDNHVQKSLHQQKLYVL